MSADEWPFDATPTRDPGIVSTSPSGTEICYALGVEPVGASHACDGPSAAGDRPTVDRSRVTGGTSAERHASVEAAGDEGVHDVDADLLADLDPDLVVSQSVCGVCAVDEDRVADAVGGDVRILGLAARTLGDVLDCVERVGAAAGRERRAGELTTACRERLGALRDSAPGDGPRVAVVEWTDPLRVAGNWVPELVAAAGGRYGLATPGEGSAAVEWETVRAYAPEVLVVAPCSHDPEGTRSRLDELAGRPGWDALPAVAADRGHCLDGRTLSRWTPRPVDVAADLRAICHPDRAPADRSRDRSGRDRG
jgi:iron complex transport system substrate-binding protein